MSIISVINLENCFYAHQSCYEFVIHFAFFFAIKMIRIHYSKPSIERPMDMKYWQFFFLLSVISSFHKLIVHEHMKLAKHASWHWNQWTFINSFSLPKNIQNFLFSSESFDPTTKITKAKLCTVENITRMCFIMILPNW